MIILMIAAILIEVQYLIQKYKNRFILNRVNRILYLIRSQVSKYLKRILKVMIIAEDIRILINQGQ